MSATSIGADAAVEDTNVQFRSDGLALPPADYARLLARLVEAYPEADEFSRGGAVAELERRMAAALGKEAALFLPSGTLANHLAVRRLARNGRRVLVQKEGHFYNDSGDCAPVLSGLALVPLAEGRTGFTVAEIEAELERIAGGRVAAPIGAIVIETPVRRMDGAMVDRDETARVTAFARERGIGLHLDGARLFVAAGYTGIAPAEYAAPFDTVYVSLYKYFNATAGAILAGPRALIDGLYHERRMFGGALRQAWPQAVVALHYLDGFAERFARSVAAAELLYRALAEHPRCRVERPTNGTSTTFLRVSGADAAALPDRLRAAGIGIGPARLSDAEGARFALVTNESLLRRPVEAILDGFHRALR